MRAAAIIALTTLSLGLFTGCTTASGGAAGALVGGLTGAGIGAIAGDPFTGALIGSGVGLAAGSLIGHDNEKDRRQEEGFVYDDIWGTRGHYERREVVKEYPPSVTRTRTVHRTTVYRPHTVHTTCTCDYYEDVVFVETHPVWNSCWW